LYNPGNYVEAPYYWGGKGKENLSNINAFSRELENTWKKGPRGLLSSRIVGLVNRAPEGKSSPSSVVLENITKVAYKIGEVRCGKDLLAKLE
jgi:hypothetical protein